VKAATLEPAYLSLRDLATYSGLSVRSLRVHLKHPTAPLPHHRIGGKVLVRRTDYDAWASRFRVDRAPDMQRVVNDLMRGLR
jgi:hypothetical protein